MFCSTLLLFGTLLVGPATPDAPSELRGPQWQGRASAPTAASAPATRVVGPSSESSTELRDPFVSPRAVLAVVQPSADAMALRDPFEGRTGLVDLRARGVDSVELRPLAPATRVRAELPTPAAREDTVDPFVPRTQPQPGAQAPTAVPSDTHDGSLRRPFGAS